MDTVTGTLEKISFNAVDESGVMCEIKLVGDDRVYLMPNIITVTLHREQSHYMAVMAAEFVSDPDQDSVNAKEERP